MVETGAVEYFVLGSRPVGKNPFCLTASSENMGHNLQPRRTGQGDADHHAGGVHMTEKTFSTSNWNIPLRTTPWQGWIANWPCYCLPARAPCLWIGSSGSRWIFWTGPQRWQRAFTRRKSPKRWPCLYEKHLRLDLICLSRIKISNACCDITKDCT